MTHPGADRPRPRTAPQTPSVDVARVAATRDEIDGIAGERRRREDALIAEYASATKEATDIVTRRDAAITRYNQQIRTLTDTAAQALATAENRRAAALAGLNEHRSVRELAAMFGLPPKRIGKCVHAHKARHEPPDSADPASCATDHEDRVAAAEGETPAPSSVTRGESPVPPSPVVRPTSSTAAPPKSAPSRCTPPDERTHGSTPSVPRPDTHGVGTARLF